MQARARTVIAAVATAAALGTTSTPAALASQGKASLGCSPAFTLDSISVIDAFSQPLVAAGYYTEDSLSALLVSLDHNGDGYLCYTVPPGFTGPAATNAAHRAGFVNLVDDKILSS